MTTRNARFSVRIPDDQKKLIKQAASQLGLSVNAFTVSALVRHAQEVVESSAHIRPSNRHRARKVV